MLLSSLLSPLKILRVLIKSFFFGVKLAFVVFFFSSAYGIILAFFGKTPLEKECGETVIHFAGEFFMMLIFGVPALLFLLGVGFLTTFGFFVVLPAYVGYQKELRKELREE